jgi:hypothetical protein
MSKIKVRGWGCVLTRFFLFLGLIVFYACIYSFAYNKALRTAKNNLKREVLVVLEECNCEKQESCTWDEFIKALIWVESRDNCNAVGDLDDVGVLQIRKVIVDDCNRILGYNKFTYEDRRDSVKSVEMFNIIQDHYNPTRDMHFALKLWNSKAPVAYHKKVFKKMEENKEHLLQE